MVVENPQASKLYGRAKAWRQEGQRLRRILLDSGLTEDVKWGKPCYTYDGKNVCIVQRMKDFLALLFFKGALLNDPDRILEVQGPNSRAGYRIRFTSVHAVETLAGSVTRLVRDAIRVEKAGLVVAKGVDSDYPSELLDRLADDPALRAAFENLTAGRRRGYALYFAGAKRSQTRGARIEKHRARILAGKGLHDP